MQCMRKLVRKSHTHIVPIVNTCSIGYPHDGRADNATYQHHHRHHADKQRYRHDRRIVDWSGTLNLNTKRTNKIYTAGYMKKKTIKKDQ